MIQGPPTLLHIRYYAETYASEDFRGKGFLGRWIRVLNWARYWLETLVQRLVMEALLRDIPVDEPRALRGVMARQFWSDVGVEQGKAPQAAAHPLLQPRALRYVQSRTAKFEQDTPESPPKSLASLETLAAEYGASAKDRRYTMRGRTLLFEEEIEHMEITPEQAEKGKEMVKAQQFKKMLQGRPLPAGAVVQPISGFSSLVKK